RFECTRPLAWVASYETQSRAGGHGIVNQALDPTTRKSYLYAVKTAIGVNSCVRLSVTVLFFVSSTTTRVGCSLDRVALPGCRVQGFCAHLPDLTSHFEASCAGDRAHDARRSQRRRLQAAVGTLLVRRQLQDACAKVVTAERAHAP
ncbi:unnamed protein product, partial [Ectocarpus sp. 4 AP-2014]